VGIVGTALASGEAWADVHRRRPHRYAEDVLPRLGLQVHHADESGPALFDVGDALDI
jgi:hypothetical protein